MVVHDMQEKFKRIKLQEKPDNPAEGFEDFGVENRPNLTSEDVINSSQNRPDPGDYLPAVLIVLKSEISSKSKIEVKTYYCTEVCHACISHHCDCPQNECYN